MSTNARSLDAGQHRCAPVRATRCPRSTDASCRAWPWVNSRSSMPNVDGAYTAPNRFFIPPARITSRSSMLSAPAPIPAITAVSFAAGFAAPDWIRDVVNDTARR